MGQVKVDGTMSAGPASGGGSFPASSFDVPLALRASPKLFVAATGVLSRSIDSPTAFVELSEVGAAGSVSRADVLYLRASGPVDLRLTTDDGVGGDVVAVVPVDGLVVLEFPVTKSAKKVEVKGTATLEVFASGQQ